MFATCNTFDIRVYTSRLYQSFARSSSAWSGRQKRECATIRVRSLSLSLPLSCYRKLTKIFRKSSRVNKMSFFKHFQKIFPGQRESRGSWQRFFIECGHGKCKTKAKRITGTVQRTSKKTTKKRVTKIKREKETGGSASASAREKAALNGPSSSARLCQIEVSSSMKVNPNGWSALLHLNSNFEFACNNWNWNRVKYLMFLYKRRAGSIIFNFAVDNKYANVCRQKERKTAKNRGEYSHEIRKTKNQKPPRQNIGSTKQNTIRITCLCLCVCECISVCVWVC